MTAAKTISILTISIST